MCITFWTYSTHTSQWSTPSEEIGQSGFVRSAKIQFSFSSHVTSTYKKWGRFVSPVDAYILAVFLSCTFTSYKVFWFVFIHSSALFPSHWQLLMLLFHIQTNSSSTCSQLLPKRSLISLSWGRFLDIFILSAVINWPGGYLRLQTHK